MKDKDQPIKGCASISKNKKKLIVGNYIPRIGMDGSVKLKEEMLFHHLTPADY